MCVRERRGGGETCARSCTCEDEDNLRFSLSTMWAPEIKLRLSSLVAWVFFSKISKTDPYFVAQTGLKIIRNTQRTILAPNISFSIVPISISLPQPQLSWYTPILGVLPVLMPAATSCFPTVHPHTFNDHLWSLSFCPHCLFLLLAKLWNWLRPLAVWLPFQAMRTKFKRCMLLGSYCFLGDKAIRRGSPQSLSTGSASR